MTCKTKHFRCDACGEPLEPHTELIRLRAELDRTRRERETLAAENARLREALQDIIDDATVETEAAVQIAIRALAVDGKGDGK